MPREMKESGVEWIGIIPKTWTVLHCNAAFIRKNEKAEQDDPVILSLARSGVKVRDISNNEGQLAESYYNYNPVEPGDLLLNTMDLVSGANCSISEVSGVISPAYVNLRARKGFDPLYYDYYFKTQYWSMAFFAHGKGVSFDNRWTLSAGDVLHYSIPVPPENEQKRIAAFLKKKIDAIDKVVIDTENSINDYKKLKQSMITDAVTKGIRSDREMKDSCIEWIGEIPKEWRVERHKNVMHKVKQICENYGGEDIISLTMNGVIIRDLDAGGKMPTSFDGYQYVEPGDLLLCLFDVDVTPRCVGLVKNHGITSPAYSRFKVHDGYLNRYYDYLLREIDDTKAFLHLAKNLRSSFTEEDFGAIHTIVPPYEEQVEIADYLDEKLPRIDSLIAQKERFLSELESYKRSIIYEYVTGKKEVPEL